MKTVLLQNPTTQARTLVRSDEGTLSAMIPPNSMSADCPHGRRRDGSSKGLENIILFQHSALFSPNLNLRAMT